MSTVDMLHATGMCTLVCVVVVVVVVVSNCHILKRFFCVVFFDLVEYRTDCILLYP